jgi:hypothetical protein
MNKAFYSLIFIVITLISCDDIFEKNLEKESVSIIAPTNNFKTNIQTQSFWWEKLKGASNYHLQIVSPSYSSIHQLILDTIIEHNIFPFTLLPGEYQWRIRANNNSSSTPYTTFSIQIDSTTNLSNQIVLLQSPLNGIYTNFLTNNYTWQSVFSATSYNIQIASPDFSSSLNIILDSTIINNNLNYTFNEEGIYQWRVKAINSSSASLFSSTRTITSDTTRPYPPTLTLPLYNSIINSQPFSFNWNRDSNQQLSPFRGDSIYIYTDSLNTPAKPAIFVTSSSYIDSLPSGIYFWRVKTIDQANNISFFSTHGKFTIN